MLAVCLTELFLSYLRGFVSYNHVIVFIHLLELILNVLWDNVAFCRKYNLTPILVMCLTNMAQILLKSLAFSDAKTVLQEALEFAKKTEFSDVLEISKLLAQVRNCCYICTCYFYVINLVNCVLSLMSLSAMKKNPTIHQSKRVWLGKWQVLPKW